MNEESGYSVHSMSASGAELGPEAPEMSDYDRVELALEMLYGVEKQYRGLAAAVLRVYELYKNVSEVYGYDNGEDDEDEEDEDYEGDESEDEEDEDYEGED